MPHDHNMKELPKTGREWGSLQKSNPKLWDRAVGEDDRRKAGETPNAEWWQSPEERTEKSVPAPVAPAPPAKTLKPLLNSQQRTDLVRLRLQFEEAAELHDADAMVAIASGERFQKLIGLECFEMARDSELKNSPTAMLALVMRENESVSLLLQAHVARRRQLERRIEALESKGAFEYRGVWNADSQFNKGDFVTQDGSMFHCNRSTRERPGASDDWQLCVKRGQNGKDAK